MSANANLEGTERTQAGAGDVAGVDTPDVVHVLIVGGGFAGLNCARALKHAPVRVTLVDQRNFHLFQPLLYQVATGALSPGDIAAPLRAVLARSKNTSVVLAEVVDFEPAAQTVVLRDGRIRYDVLVVAAGAVNSYFGHQDWPAHAPGLKSVEEATEIRRRVLLAFESAERAEDAALRRAYMTFVVVGGGATGVELAGALAEIAIHTLRGEFRRLDPRDAHVILVEGAERVLPPFRPELSTRAQESLAALGVDVRTGTIVRSIDARGVTIGTGEREERIEARTVLWGAGVRANALGERLAGRTGAEIDRGGRVVVNEDLTIPGHPEIFVIGDLANAKDAKGAPLPGVAPVAIQEGRYVARMIRARIHRNEGASAAPFRYRDRGSLATIGRSKAVADLGFARVSGFFAWVLWLFVHLMYLVGFENRVLVIVQWAWSYFTWNRGARLITGEQRLPELDQTTVHDEPSSQPTQRRASGAPR